MDEAFDKQDFFTEFLFKTELVKDLNFFLKLDTKQTENPQINQDWATRLFG